MDNENVSKEPNPQEENMENEEEKDLTEEPVIDVPTERKKKKRQSVAGYIAPFMPVLAFVIFLLFLMFLDAAPKQWFRYDFGDLKELMDKNITYRAQAEMAAELPSRGDPELKKLYADNFSSDYEKTGYLLIGALSAVIVFCLVGIIAGIDGLLKKTMVVKIFGIVGLLVNIAAICYVVIVHLVPFLSWFTQ